MSQLKSINVNIGAPYGRVNLANAGAPFIPVQTHKRDLNTLCELFEWKLAKNFNLNCE